MRRSVNSHLDSINTDTYNKLGICFDRLPKDNISNQINTLFMFLHDEFGDNWNNDQVFVMTVMGMYAARIKNSL